MPPTLLHVFPSPRTGSQAAHHEIKREHREKQNMICNIEIHKSNWKPQQQKGHGSPFSRQAGEKQLRRKGGLRPPPNPAAKALRPQWSLSHPPLFWGPGRGTQPSFTGWVVVGNRERSAPAQAPSGPCVVLVAFLTCCSQPRLPPGEWGRGLCTQWVMVALRSGLARQPLPAAPGPAHWTPGPGSLLQAGLPHPASRQQVPWRVKAAFPPHAPPRLHLPPPNRSGKKTGEDCALGP